MPSMLELAAGLPVVELQPREELSAEGSRSGSVWVLVDGRLGVVKDGVRVNVIERPGAVIGEIAVLLGTGNSATVVAETVATVRHATDGESFLRTHPEVSTHVARGLAERLNFVTTYLADLQNQYAGSPGLAMASEVLAELVARQGPVSRPGSARDPDPQY